MSTETIKLTSDKKFIDRTIILPVVGEAYFDKEGMLEVTIEQAVELIELTKGSIDLYNPFTKEEEDRIAELNKTEDQKATEELGKLIESATTEELLELAKESKLPPETLAGMTDRRLRNELLKQAGLPVKRGK
jgi:hypothetical protein